MAETSAVVSASSHAYRYMSPGEVAVIRSRTRWTVPNVNIAGRPELAYLAYGFYRSEHTAEAGLRLGALNPAGPTVAPSDRLDVDIVGIVHSAATPVLGGTGTEFTTSASPRVTAITAPDP